MRLPSDAVGPTDTLKYIECPRRFAHGMRRHELGRDLGEDGLTDTFPATAYGSAFHMAVELSEKEVLPDEEAVSRAIAKYARWLWPDDRTRLLQDLQTYHRRDQKGVETVLAEGEIRVPLMVHNGVQIWFRTKVDRLYRRRDNPNAYIHIDYKTSRWAKSKEEVHNDRQMWAVNWALYEWIEREFLVAPESLKQVYDQLRYGEEPTSKNAAQRAEMHAWLCDVVRGMLDDEQLEHRYNQWCAYCPILVGCPVVNELSEFALSRIAALAPTRPKLKKDGTPGKQTTTEIDGDFYDEALAALPEVKDALKVLSKVRDLVTDELKTMPDDDRARRGYGLRDQERTYWPDEAVAEILEARPDLAPTIASITKTSVEKELKGEPETLEYVMSLSAKRQIDPELVPLQG